MTLRSKINRNGKAPRVAALILSRETLCELTENDAAAVAGGKPNTSYAPAGTCGCKTAKPKCQSTGGFCDTYWCSIRVGCTSRDTCPLPNPFPVDFLRKRR